MRINEGEMIYRGVISQEVGLCVSGCGTLESAQHLFLSCSSFALLWQMVRDWIGFVGVDTNVLSDHFVQFVHFTGGSKLEATSWRGRALGLRTFLKGVEASVRV
ncbi:hypothetical protein MTR_6g087750 [Medicago truncatula]|uniref:Reverse transcriptase zinc-binding domain-containing protein n=1 Tax=Medicago truncatula TaxID=3880 RepID=G7KPE1_MEDTR|nr:hypothetical protein MTR_6g087750 [Medicago truncatula]